jgi:hypothetical protein
MIAIVAAESCVLQGNEEIARIAEAGEDDAARHDVIAGFARITPALTSALPLQHVTVRANALNCCSASNCSPRSRHHRRTSPGEER